MTLPLQVGQGVTAVVDLQQLVVLEEQDVARVGQEGGDGGGYEILAFPYPEHERAVPARRRDDTRLLAMHRDHRESPSTLPSALRRASARSPW